MCRLPKRRNITPGRNRGGQRLRTAAQGLGAKGLQLPRKTKTRAWRWTLSVGAQPHRPASVPRPRSDAAQPPRRQRDQDGGEEPAGWGRRAEEVNLEPAGGAGALQKGQQGWGRLRQLLGRAVPSERRGGGTRLPGRFPALFQFTGRKGASKGQLCCALCFWIRHA